MLSTIFLALLVILILFRRQIFPWLLLFFVGKLMKKMEKNVKKTQEPKPQKTQAKPSDKMGEYIDYEEID